jgi:hypothetical protein
MVTTVEPGPSLFATRKAAATFKANGGADDIPFAWLMAAMIAAIGGGA